MKTGDFDVRVVDRFLDPMTGWIREARRPERRDTVPLASREACRTEDGMARCGPPQPLQPRRTP